ncbi:NAD-dependent epimerase/dehydratase family protein [Psychrobacillus sp. NEAU-3TGS]|uniref:NAD-dependent epimerase/dehydratase family protein n=1 Tax=Psychrobacillus sp. NEAU-3TGS TaxID=2995412 RepID=UPI00249946A9|nr:NAD-dependent epimerase/dehydratase family protein [Psychrobacillus sp. NEAU-3TGS]MDI2589752.1 NAD-dependent epimerase/dehydratase family protein [Psychrobacillus sp. NEAU-3TGS]
MKNLLEKIKDQQIFITGGAGFIGSTLAGILLESNKVIIYDNFDRDALKDKVFRSHPNLTVVKGDVLDLKHLKENIKGSNYVIHCAGIAGIDTVVKNPVKTMQVNMVGSANLLEAATTLEDCKRVICFSTSEVFGQLAFKSQETSPAVLGAVGEARWTYAVSKLAEEHMAYAYYKQYNLPTVSVRPFNVYGPSQVGEGALRTFITKALNNEEIQIHGDGTQIRAWCYVDDMVEGVLRTLVYDNAVGESFNIGNSRTVTTIYGLANTVIRTLESESKVSFVAKTAVDIELRVPQTDKAKEILEFEAKVDLEEGIAKTAEFFKRKVMV